MSVSLIMEEIKDEWMTLFIFMHAVSVLWRNGGLQELIGLNKVREFLMTKWTKHFCIFCMILKWNEMKTSFIEGDPISINTNLPWGPQFLVYNDIYKIIKNIYWLLNTKKNWKNTTVCM